MFRNCHSTPIKICRSNCLNQISSCVPFNMPIFSCNWQGGSSCFPYSALKIGNLIQPCLRVKYLTWHEWSSMEHNWIYLFFFFFLRGSCCYKCNVMSESNETSTSTYLELIPPRNYLEQIFSRCLTPKTQREALSVIFLIPIYWFHVLQVYSDT